MFSALITICGGILAASPFIISKRPDAKQLIDKLVPYQGWIGIVLFVWGIFDTLAALSLMQYGLVYGIIAIASAITELAIGFILGFALISKYALSKNEAAMKKGEEIRAKLLKFEVPLGFIAIGLGLLYLLFIFGVLSF